MTLLLPPLSFYSEFLGLDQKTTALHPLLTYFHNIIIPEISTQVFVTNNVNCTQRQIRCVCNVCIYYMVKVVKTSIVAQTMIFSLNLT